MDDLQREVRYLRFSRDLTREFVQSSGGMKKVMSAVFAKVLTTMDAEAGSLWITDAATKTNICHQAEGPAKAKILGLRLPLGQGIVGQVIAKNTMDVVLDCAKDARFSADVDQKSHFKTESMICIPLADKGVAFGALQIINKRSGIQKQFTEDDLRLVEDLALSAAIAVRNARQQQLESDNRTEQVSAMQREVQYFRFARDLTREFVQSSGGLKQVMTEIFAKVLSTMNAEAGSLWLTDERSGTNICHQAEGPAKGRILGLRLPLGQGIVGQVISSNKADVVLNCALDSRFDAQVDKRSNFKTESMICVPLSEQGSAFGAIQIINKHSGYQKRFTEEDQRLAEDLALSASVAVRNARLLESESRVKEMNTLMELSRQISASVDMDEVLLLAVTLSGELAEISHAAIALVDETSNALFLAMLSGGVKVDASVSWQSALLALLEQVRQAKRLSYIPDLMALREQQGKETPWTEFLAQRGSVAAWSMPLADTEGILGVLWLESDRKHFASGTKSDMISILATQITVALRNASLFKRIPFSSVMSRLGDSGKKWAVGWRKRVALLLAGTAIATGLHHLPIFRSVSGDCVVDSRFGQGVYLRVAGRIQKTLVKEGDQVQAGDVLAKIDEMPIRLRLVEAETKLALLDRQIIEAKAASDASALSRALIDRLAAKAAWEQAKLDMEQVEIRAPLSGVILTARTEELVGRELGLGNEILRIANPDNFTVVIQLPEEDVSDVRSGQSVHGVLKSRPGQGFRGEVLHVGRAYTVPTEALEKGVTDKTQAEGFIAEVRVLEKDVPLLPGMTGRASISTPEVSVMTRFWRRVVNLWSFWIARS
ncbi:GAF domain-containing protein [Candidatus Magnetaquicoccus inordinatus]|uniref:GAF domain-containing protein n=1 Tax=Candidatus Magnetaquicoccus inordinatus TaxID=2496818 RepID=UPI00187D27A6|nr:GAF domain-containing protein [Candidatus Magnetaquicoccus inordinatus]